MDTRTPTEREFSQFGALLKAALGERVKAETFLDMFAPHGIMEFPYAPSGGVTRIEGRAPLAHYLRHIGSHIAFDQLHLTALHGSHETDAIILEFTCQGHAVATEKPYPQRYISVITTTDGYISRYVDYWNPLLVLDALGGHEAFRNMMGDFAAAQQQRGGGVEVRP